MISGIEGERTAVHPTVRIVYPVRSLGAVFASAVVASAMYGRHGRWLEWTVVLLYGLVWPHVAYVVASRSRNSKAAELRNLLVDGFFIGCLPAFASFEPWPTAAIIICVLAGTVSVGGPLFALRALGLTVLGALAGGALTGFVVESESTTLTTSLSITGVAAYLTLFGYHSNVQTRRAVKARQEVQRQKQQVEEARRLAEDAREAALAASHAKSAFLANMSHELRTPLNAIIGYSDMLEEVAADSHQDMVADLQKIRTAGRHLLSLIDSILDLSKVEAGQMALTVDTVDIAALVAEVAVTVRPLVEKRGNTFEVVCPPDVGTAQCDGIKVRQILLNLLSNASKFTEGGRVALTVTRDGSPGAASLLFAVEDSGIGMTSEEQSRLFEPFVQANAATTLKYGGTGLGLALSRRFARLMGGDVDLESAKGAGTCFTLRIPTAPG